MRKTVCTVLAALWAIPTAASTNPPAAPLPSTTLSSNSTPISLEQAMAHPDWIGTPVENAWWSWDSKQVYFKQKRTGSPVRDTYVATQPKPRLVANAELANLDAEKIVYNRTRTRAILHRNGDLFERDLKTGALTQITRGTTGLAAPQYAADERSVQFRAGHEWLAWNRADHLISPLAVPRATKDPAADPDADELRDMQLRLIATLKRQKDEKDELREQSERERKLDPTRAPAPIYLGDKVAIEASALAPNGRWLLLVTQPKSADKGRIGKLPRYVTESGYEEFDDQRPRVGRNTPPAHTLQLVDLVTRKVTELKFDNLPGVNDDPLASLRAERKLAALKQRAVRVDDDGEALRWSQDGSQAAVTLRSVDNKDRWIATVDLDKRVLRPLHRITDPAWVNNTYNDFGWLPDNRTLWFQSEESGYAHVYTLLPGATPRALTSGAWEATRIQWSADGGTAYMVCNPKNPGIYEVCAASLKDGHLRELTTLEGVEQFTISPDERRLLVHYSASYLPMQLATAPISGGAATRLTDTRSPAFKARSWITPQYVAVPSTHGAAPIWSKLYRPATLEPGRRYPVVLFVHGAGYLQNASHRYPIYFREQMFHNMLVQQGYIVLDMDYRASKGYGRDWRTAIYRRMGHPELEDYLDGVKWMVEHQQGDATRVGIYGGSYGGFMSLIALMRAPDIFHAGAALRPVTDWTTYNHEYTSNILNTPDIDPLAYKVSSPIEYAEGLRGHLLISHGMIDDNVFYQDSVRLTQRLIELRKDNWELANFPLERHAFVQPESWFDQYRRVYKLFERALK
jgi:dipeptidyl aminopeptidase/acylaminoacyl peptidase